ncbi:hypothetical protein LBMAG42_21610 [Deltaproteobacteria bacterium]|nr:hypothetical protein LBMAG42_21610 [Deltaproteobacteria bacterium]
MLSTEVTRFNPFESIRQMQNYMDRAFPWRFTAPMDLPVYTENLPLDVYDEDGHLVVRAALPGVKPDDVKVKMTDDILDITAESKDESEVRNSDYYLKEYSASTWHRSLRLPANVKADKATAKFNNGFLTLRIPRTEGSSSRSIEVKVS